MASSLVGTSISTRESGVRVGRNSSRSRIGSMKAAVLPGGGGGGGGGGGTQYNLPSYGYASHTTI